ncbi:MAG: DegV family protein [Clostridium sp.]
MGIKLITDSACDLPIEYIKENNIEVASLEVNINNEFKKDDLGQTLKYKDFYEIVRNGAMPSTSQVNVGTFEKMFRKYVENGDSIIYISLSSPLSGTFNSANIARLNLIDEYENADITLVDSISVSLGEGALVYYANEMIKEEKSKEEIVDWLENNKQKVIHSIVIDDLSHLKRGGRISGTAAAVGGLLGIKPTLKVDSEGKVSPGVKIKGKKKVIKYILDDIRENGTDIENQTLFICHGDVIDEANELKEAILAEFKFKNVVMNCIGAVIGTHGGPGVLAAVFLGKGR